MNIHKFKIILLLIVGVSFSACKDYLDVNTDPNQSTTSRIDLQLSSAQLQTSIGIGQRIFPNLSIWDQYYTGGPGVSIGDPDQHKLSSSEANEVFRTLYRSNVNLNFITNNSSENFYIAIAKIMKAYNFQVCADLFGDIPYSEALRGDIADGSILHPHYESAKDVVYPGIEAELLDAIRTLKGGGGFTHPGTDDLIYGGDLDLWSKFAHTLLLKIYLRQGPSGQAKAASLYNDDTAPNGVTGDDKFIISNDENAKVSFPGGASGSNPFWNATKSTSLGNFYVATTTAFDYLTMTSDPRLDAFFDPRADGTHLALYPGSIESIPPGVSFSTPEGALKPNGGFLFSPTAPVILMSAWEGNLLLAEAGARGWIGTDVGAVYENAVHASFEYLGLGDLSDSTYLSTPGAGYLNTGADVATQIKTIALQKWVSMISLQPVESWIETRRFDSPATPIFASPGGIFKSPTKNALPGGAFPSIMPYPENEESLNQNFPGPHALTDKVFWDN